MQSSGPSEGVIKVSRLYVENFGPLVRGELRISNLTVIAGPQSSGKSMLTTLVYMLDKEVPSTFVNLLFQALRDELARRGLTGAVPPPGVVEVARQSINDLSRRAAELLESSLKAMMPQLLARYYTVGPGTLVREGADKGTVEATMTYGSHDVLRLRVELEKSGGVSLSAGVEPSALMSLIEAAQPSALLEGPLFAVTYRAPRLPSLIYIPAERIAYTKDLASYTALLLSSLPAIPSAAQQAQERLQRLGIPQPIIDYMIIMESIAGADAEYELLGLGRVKVSGRSMFFVDRAGAEFPMSLASSGVAQLAGTLMPLQGLRGRPLPLSLAIIEEPENDLHPDMQIDLVDALIEAARDFDLIMTTHSDFVLAEVSYLNAAHRLRGLSAYYVDPDDYVLKGLEVSGTGEVELPKTMARALEALSRRALSLIS